MSRPDPHNLSDYPYHHTIPTRWADNDMYGHINNAVYYFYFDTLVNHFLIEKGLLNISQPQFIGLVVDTGCSFFAPIRFPDLITAGLRTAHIGRTSVRYEIGLFRQNEAKASAQGHFVHVYVDHTYRRPQALAPLMRTHLDSLRIF